MTLLLGNNFVLVWSERDRITVIARIKEAMMRGGVNKHTVGHAFAAIDTDSSGAVNRQEFYSAINALKIEMTPKALKKLWHTIDVDGSGEIRVSEFAELLFPEVEGIDDIDEDHDGENNFVSDPVLMKLILQEKSIGGVVPTWNKIVLFESAPVHRFQRLICLPMRTRIQAFAFKRPFWATLRLVELTKRVTFLCQALERVEGKLNGGGEARVYQYIIRV